MWLPFFGLFPIEIQSPENQKLVLPGLIVELNGIIRVFSADNSSPNFPRRFPNTA